MKKPAYSVMQSAPGPETVLDGKTYLYFGGTSYYGLHQHPDLMQAGIRAWETLGTNTATTRRGAGTAPVHLDVEQAAAKFFNTEAAGYLATGYLSNAAGTQALLRHRPFDCIFLDAHAHYCVQEAARSTGLGVYTFAHRDAADLRDQLQAQLKPGQVPLVMTDGLFPGVGVLAPLPDYLATLAEFDGLLWVDDAHAAGVLGPHGRGTAEHFSLTSERLYSGATLSKAFGGFGGIITGTEAFIAHVRDVPVMTGASAPPNPIAAATHAGIQLLAAHPEWRQQLWANARALKTGLQQLGVAIEVNDIPIATFAHGTRENMQRIFDAMRERGISIQFSPYPGLNEDGMLRMAVFANHTREQISRLIDAFKALL